MRTRPGRRGGCLTAFLMTMGVLTLLVILACAGCVFFIVRGQKVYQNPEEVRAFAARLCDSSLLKGFEPVEAVEANLFLFRLEFARFARPSGGTLPAQLAVGRMTASFQIDQPERRVRGRVQDRSDPEIPPGMELVESYAVHRDVDGEEVEFFVSLYQPARAERPEAPAGGEAARSGADSEGTVGKAAAEGEQKASTVESTEGVSERTDRSGEGEGATQKHRGEGNQAEGVPSEQGEEAPLIPPDKKGDWVVVVGVRSEQNVGRFVQFAGPRDAWDETSFIELLMSVR